jgi:hypothetical protein
MPTSTTTAGLNTTQIRVAGTGAFWKAPLATVLPADSVAAWGAAFVNLGFAKSGFTITPSLKTTPVVGWQSTNILRNIVTEQTRKYGFELQQSNINTLAMAWNGTIVPGLAGAYSMTIPNQATAEEFVLGIDWSDGTTNQRIILPRASIITLPVIKGDRTAETTYAFEVQELVPGDNSQSVLIFGVDDAVSGV